MIKRAMWFITGLATGAGTVVVLGKRMKRRLAELTPVRLADRGVQRVKSMGTTVREALHEGVDAMRHREQELQDRFHGDRDPSSAGEDVDSSKVIVLPDRQARRSTRSSSTASRSQGSSRKS